MERCPNCRARGDGSETCRRCGMNLSGLLAVERASEHLRGISHLAVAETQAAKSDLTRALRLHSAPFTELLLGFAGQLEETGPGHLTGTNVDSPKLDQSPLSIPADQSLDVPINAESD